MKKSNLKLVSAAYCAACPGSWAVAKYLQCRQHGRHVTVADCMGLQLPTAAMYAVAMQRSTLATFSICFGDNPRCQDYGLSGPDLGRALNRQQRSCGKVADILPMNITAVSIEQHLVQLTDPTWFRKRYCPPPGGCVKKLPTVLHLKPVAEPSER